MSNFIGQQAVVIGAGWENFAAKTLADHFNRCTWKATCCLPILDRRCSAGPAC
jgi:hypothetical protein